MDFALGVIIFILGLLVSIALHEVGHLVPAKRFGVKVPEYFVGFGRTLWSTMRGETEYGIKLFPLGGFVRLLGMYPPTKPGAKQTWLQRSPTTHARMSGTTSTPPMTDACSFKRRPTRS